MWFLIALNVLLLILNLGVIWYGATHWPAGGFVRVPRHGWPQQVARAAPEPQNRTASAAEEGGYVRHSRARVRRRRRIQI